MMEVEHLLNCHFHQLEMIQYMSSFNNKTPVAALFKLDPGGNAIEA
jgi:hypothetical protein